MKILSILFSNSINQSLHSATLSHQGAVIPYINEKGMFHNIQEFKTPLFNKTLKKIYQEQ